MIDLSSFNKTVDEFIEQTGVYVWLDLKLIMFDLLAGVV